MMGELASRRGAGDPVESGKQGKVAHHFERDAAPRCCETLVPRDVKDFPSCPRSPLRGHPLEGPAVYKYWARDVGVNSCTVVQN